MKVLNCMCGGKASISRQCFEDEDLRYVRCHDCGKESDGHWNGNRAIIQWNNIIKAERVAKKVIKYISRNNKKLIP